MPRPLYPQGKNPSYTLDRRPGGPQSSSGCGGEEKNSQHGTKKCIQNYVWKNPKERGHLEDLGVEGR
jgi:hypothetical protein